MQSYYEIKRGVRTGKNLTPAQRTSSLFAEEPVVLGKVLRRGAGPLRISEELYEINKMNLLRLEKAGAIVISKPETAAVVASSEVIVPPPPEDPSPPPPPPPEPPKEDPAPPEEPKEEPPTPPSDESSTPTPPVEETASAAPTEDQPRKRKGRKE